MSRFALLLLFCALTFFFAGAATAAPNTGPVAAGTPNVLIFELRLDGSTLADSLTAYESGKEILLPLGELTRLLTLGITVDPRARVASGFILSEDRLFRLDLPALKVSFGGSVEAVDPVGVRWLDDDIYASGTLLQRWLPVDLKPDLSTLIIDVLPREKLPIQARLERERAAKGLRARGGGYQDPGYPHAIPDYSLLSIPFIDQTLGLDYQGGHGSSKGNWAYSSYLTADLLGMEGSLYLSTSKGADKLDHRLTLSRNDPDGELLGLMRARSLTLGNMGVPSLNNVLRGSGSGNGALISNRALSQSSSYDHHTFRGDLPPGWDVTLYLNDALIAMAHSRADGTYEFADQQLMYGINEFRLMFNGPMGQTRVERHVFNIDQNLAKPGDFFYTLGGVQDDNNRLRGSALFDLGLFKQLALSGGAVSMPQSSGGSATTEDRRFYSLGLRTSLLAMLLNSDFVLAEQGGSLYEIGLKTQVMKYSIDFTHTGLSADFVSDFYSATTDQIKFKDRARVSGSLPLWGKQQLPLAVDLSREETRSGIQTLDVQGRLSLNVLETNLTNSLSWNKRDSSTSSGGTLQASRRVAGINFSSQAAYTLEPDTKIASLALNGDINFGQTSRLSVGVLHVLDPSQTTFTTGVTHNFGTFGVGLSGRYVNTGEYALGTQLFMALSRDPRSGALVPDWQPIAGSGAVSARAFLDANQNGMFDPGEKPIEGAGFTMNEGGRHPVKTDASGVAYLSRLQPKQYTDLALDTSTLEDPQWLPTVKGMRILPRPGKVQNIDFPVVMTGEVDGTVFLEDGGKKRGIGNALVELVDEHGTVVASGRSSSDGYYIIPSVRPGRYKAMVSPTQLEKLGLDLTQPVELAMRGDGDFINGKNFTLKRKGTIAPDEPIMVAKVADAKAGAEQEGPAKTKQKEEQQADDRLLSEKLEIEAVAITKARLDKIKLEEERLEKERLVSEQLERERLLAEKQEMERVAAAKAEQERLAKAKLEEERLLAKIQEIELISLAKAEQERLDNIKLEEDRQLAEKQEMERVAAATAEEERLVKAKLEEERMLAEKQEQERVAAAKADQERLAKAKLEEERLLAEKQELERVAAAKAEEERLAKAEQERLAKAKLEEDRQLAEKQELERIAAAKAEEERLAKAEQERLAKAKLEEERQLAEMKEMDRVATVKAEQELIAKTKLEEERQLAEKLEMERIAAAKAEQERIAKAKLEEERQLAEKQEQELIAAAKAEQERLAKAKLEEERQLAEKQEMERVAAAKAEEERLAKAEQERLANAKLEEERQLAEKQEMERIAAAKAEEERLATAEQERLAKAKLEEELQLAEKLEMERVAAAKAEEERLAKAEQERIAKAKLVEERQLAEKQELERVAAAKAEQERLAKAKLEEERLMAEKQEMERVAAAKAERERLANLEMGRKVLLKRSGNGYVNTGAVAQDQKDENVSRQRLFRRSSDGYVNTGVVVPDQM